MFESLEEIFNVTIEFVHTEERYLETAPLVILLNFSEINFIKGTLNQIFLSEQFSTILFFCLIVLSLIKLLILTDIVLKIKSKG